MRTILKSFIVAPLFVVLSANAVQTVTFKKGAVMCMGKEEIIYFSKEKVEITEQNLRARKCASIEAIGPNEKFSVNDDGVIYEDSPAGKIATIKVINGNTFFAMASSISINKNTRGGIGTRYYEPIDSDATKFAVKCVNGETGVINLDSGKHCTKNLEGKRECFVSIRDAEKHFCN